jgi:hypothetical protein
MYPDTGNGGYISVHTDVDLVYDAVANKFLPGNHVVLTDRATQCLTQALQQIQRDYGGRSITEPELEAVYHRWMPNQSAACRARLTNFFAQWFDTAYPGGGGRNRPQITGPGLAGPGFYNTTGGCGTPGSPHHDRPGRHG